MRDETLPDKFRITRTQAAEIMGVSVRTVSRYLRDGVLTRYGTPRGKVWLDRREASAMNTVQKEGTNA